MNLDERFMKRAVELSKAAVEHGNEPFGAVLVKNGEIVFENENQIYTLHDPTFHGEAGLIRRFCAETAITDLSEYTLYSSCEPCFMCSGAMVWVKLGRLVYGATNTDLEAILGKEGTDSSKEPVLQLSTILLHFAKSPLSHPPVLTREIRHAIGFKSTPTDGIPTFCAASSVEPLPQNGSNMRSPCPSQRQSIRLAGISLINFAGYGWILLSKEGLASEKSHSTFLNLSDTSLPPLIMSRHGRVSYLLYVLWRNTCIFI